MPITPDHIRETLDDYLDAHPDEKWQLAVIAELLDAAADLACRKEFRGHVTAGAILTDPPAAYFTSNTAPSTAGSCPAATSNPTTPASSPPHSAN